VGGVSGQEHPAVAVPVGVVGADAPRQDADDFDVEIGNADGAAYQPGAAVAALARGRRPPPGSRTPRALIVGDQYGLRAGARQSPYGLAPEPAAASPP